MRIIGLMSGTSADGIDVALVEIEGQSLTLQIQLIKHLTISYESALQAEIFACFRPETSSIDRLCRLNVALGEAYAAAILTLIAAANFTPEQVDLIGSHGQAMWYDPPQNGLNGAVLTLGEPAVIAERTGITTLTNFRSRDLAAGGRGAPLVSYLDWLLFRHPTLTRAIQNIGGIANVTALPPLGVVALPLAFDTGPGNMLIDYCVRRATADAQPYDRDGLIAASGRVDPTLLGELMQHPYLRQPAPKTTGREIFGVQFGQVVWERGTALGLESQDIVATITAFTAESIVVAYREWLPWTVDEVYIAGGGALNPTLLTMLQARLGKASVHRHDDLGMPPAAKECILFALLAYETWHGRPVALPQLTGASHPVILGNITPGKHWPPR